MTYAERLKTASSCTRGAWQGCLIIYGQDTLRGRACNWRASYIRSFNNLINRLQKQGIPALGFYREFTFSLIIGTEWVELGAKVFGLIKDAETVIKEYIPRAMENKELARKIRKLGLRWDLRRFVARSKRILEKIAKHCGDANRSILVDKNPDAAHHHLEEATNLVKKWEEEWKDIIAIVENFKI